MEKKKSGLPVAKRAAAPTGGNVFNLMDVLKASLKGGKGETAPNGRRTTKKAPPKPKRKAG